MLVRLLDAFVWRNQCRREEESPTSPIEKRNLSPHPSRELDFTYVQGMNVLAAPFLYTMPSEVEAFFCFSRFIEEACPLYVQPTLEGVHRGLKVSLKIVAVFRLADE
jgi:cell cycle arrest protein BUB2